MLQSILQNTRIARSIASYSTSQTTQYLKEHQEKAVAAHAWELVDRQNSLVPLLMEDPYVSRDVFHELTHDLEDPVTGWSAAELELYKYDPPRVDETFDGKDFIKYAERQTANRRPVSEDVFLALIRAQNVDVLEKLVRTTRYTFNVSTEKIVRQVLESDAREIADLLKEFQNVHEFVADNAAKVLHWVVEFRAFDTFEPLNPTFRDSVQALRAEDVSEEISFMLTRPDMQAIFTWLNENEITLPIPWWVLSHDLEPDSQAHVFFRNSVPKSLDGLSIDHVVAVLKSFVDRSKPDMLEMALKNYSLMQRVASETDFWLLRYLTQTSLDARLYKLVVQDTNASLDSNFSGLNPIVALQYQTARMLKRNSEQVLRGNDSDIQELEEEIQKLCNQWTMCCKEFDELR